MLQIGWKAGPEQYPPVELMEYAVSADKAGFDLLDVSDHFNPWSEEGQAPFTWTWLGAVATHTERIILSPGVTCPILRYHPAIIAQAAATVSHFAPNRTWLGLGTGEALNEFAVTGEWPTYAERRDRLEEAITLIRALWSGEEVTFEGKHGDGLWSVGGKEPDLYKGIIKSFEESAKKAGKDPARLPRLIELNVSYNNDVDAAVQEQIKYWAGSYVPALFEANIYTPAMSQENGQVVGPDTIKKTGCFSNSVEDHVKYAQQHIELGFDSLIFHTAGPDQRAFIDGFARDVFPRLRALNDRQAQARCL